MRMHQRAKIFAPSQGKEQWNSLIITINQRIRTLLDMRKSLLVAALTALSLIVSLTSHAGKDSCAHSLRRHAVQQDIGAAFLDCTIYLPIGVCYHWQSHQMRKHANILKSAHLEFHNASSPGPLNKHQKRLDKFYNHLVAKFPSTTLSKDEVRQALDDLYHNGSKSKFTRKFWTGKDNDIYIGLSRSLFKDGDLSYYESHKDEYQRAQYQNSSQAKTDAQEIRARKNLKENHPGGEDGMLLDN